MLLIYIGMKALKFYSFPPPPLPPHFHCFPPAPSPDHHHISIVFLHHYHHTTATFLLFSSTTTTFLLGFSSTTIFPKQFLSQTISEKCTSELLHSMAASKDILFWTPRGQLLRNIRIIPVTNIAEVLSMWYYHITMT